VVIYKEEYCRVDGCNESAEKAHLITRASLPKRLWNDQRFFIYLCRKHHSSQHNMGINSFCNKYSFNRELKEARILLSSEEQK